MIYNTYAEQSDTVAGLELVSCGHIFAQPGRQIDRPRGREDWLLFYIAAGEETFYLPEPAVGRPGDFILFAPGESQRHRCTGSRTGEFYFVHFKGEQLPPEMTLESGRLYHLPLKRQFCDAFEQIINETLGKQPFYERLCLYKLLQLLTELERELLRQNHPAKEHFKSIARAVQHMNQHYDQPFTLADYAQMCNMSKYHFLRVFEEIVGSTPVEYRNRIRLEHAADLLVSEGLGVEETARLTGFASASYFSSAFKRQYGRSPKQYQRQQQ